MNVACFIALIALAMIATVSEAQVYKCNGPDGKITYSGTPCAGPGNAIPAYKLGGNSVAATRDQAPTQAREQINQPTQAQQQDAPCRPDDAAVRDIQVRLTSQIYSEADKRVLNEEGGRLLGCEFAQLTPEERQARLHALQQLGKGRGDAASRSVGAELDALYDHHRSETQKRTAAIARQTKTIDRARRANENTAGGGAIDASGNYYPNVGGGVIDPRTGKFCPSTGAGTYVCN